MLSGLVRLILNLVVFALVIMGLTAAWLIVDGLNDSGDHADCALVLGNAVEPNGAPGTVLKERLDKVVDLYKAGKFPMVVVSGGMEGGTTDEAAAMSRYLVSCGIPATAILEDHGGVHTEATASAFALLQQERHFQSVMVVTHYYHITRTKLALEHYHVDGIEQAHAGTLRGEDVYQIGREVVGIYDYLFHWYLGPAADRAKVQAQRDADKAKAELQDNGAKLKDDLKADGDKAKQKLDH